MIQELKQKLGSLLKALDVFYVIKDLKPCSRIMVKEEMYEKVKSILNEYKLFVSKSEFKVLRLDDGNFSNKGERIDLSDERKGYYFVYFSKDKNLIDKAKEYEEKDDHINLGLSLGYPKCCCEFFAKNYKSEKERFNDYILAGLRDSEGFVFPFYNNFAIRYFDFSLLSHFPCNFKCEESIKIAKKNLDAIEKDSNEYFASLRDMLKSAVVYTENYGVFVLREPKIEGSTVKYGAVIGDKDNQLAKSLVKFKKFEVIGKNHIKVGGEDIKTKNLGFMFFI